VSRRRRKAHPRRMKVAPARTSHLVREPGPVNASAPDVATAVGVEDDPLWVPFEAGSLVALAPSACVAGVVDCGAVLATRGHMGEPTGGTPAIPVGTLSFG
jgi:hypothetical protein